MSAPPPPATLQTGIAPKRTYQRGQYIASDNESNLKNSYTLLVISADGNDWIKQFEGKALVDNKKIVVYDTCWARLHIESVSALEKPGDKSIVCKLPNADGSEIQIHPDFVIFRSFPNDLFGTSYRRQVLSLVYSGIGGVNTVDSVLRGMDRPVVHGEMVRIASRIGWNKFPVINAKYHPNGPTGNKQRLIPMNFPTVIKVGSSYGGYGKMIAHDKQEYDDIISLLALSTEYFTEEPLIKHDYEFRVQVIGPYVRCFRRNSHNNWKNQCGNVYFTDHAWHPEYSIWVDQVRLIFGGLDMFGIDVLYNEQNQQNYILEINDYAMGFDADYEWEDKQWVAEVVVQRMNEWLCHIEKKNFVGVFVQSQYTREQLRGKK